MQKNSVLRPTTADYKELQNATFFYIFTFKLHFTYKYYKCSAFSKKCSSVNMLL